MTEHVQFGFVCGAVPLGGGERTPDGVGSNIGVTSFPWQVPEGKVFRLTDAHFASKHPVHTGDERSSYMHILLATDEAHTNWSAALSLSDLGPNLNFKRYFEMQSGWWLHVSFVNASPEPQNMSGLILGYLTKAKP